MWQGTRLCLVPHGSVLVPHVQMRFLWGTHPVRWYHLPVLAAGPGLGLLSLCSLYHYHSPFLMQITPYLVWAAVPWGPCPNIMKALLLSQSRSQEQGGFWLEHAPTRVGVPILQDPLHVHTIHGLLQRHITLPAALPIPSTLWPNWGCCLPDPVLCLILPARRFVPTGQAPASVTPALRFIQVSLAVQTLGLKH